jgi:hypothetical protein
MLLTYLRTQVILEEKEISMADLIIYSVNRYGDITTTFVTGGFDVQGDYTELAEYTRDIFDKTGFFWTMTILVEEDAFYTLEREGWKCETDFLSSFPLRRKITLPNKEKPILLEFAICPGTTVTQEDIVGRELGASTGP